MKLNSIKRETHKRRLAMSQDNPSNIEEQNRKKKRKTIFHIENNHIVLSQNVSYNHVGM